MRNWVAVATANVLAYTLHESVLIQILTKRQRVACPHVQALDQKFRKVGLEFEGNELLAVLICVAKSKVCRRHLSRRWSDNVTVLIRVAENIGGQCKATLALSLLLLLSSNHPLHPRSQRTALLSAVEQHAI